MEGIALVVGLLGLIGLAGFAAFKHPIDKARAGKGIRVLGLLGLLGFAGIWIDGAGACGAFGSLGLWNHQSPRLAFWGRLGWIGLAGLPFLVLGLLA